MNNLELRVPHHEYLSWDRSRKTNMASSKAEIFNDPIHGSIELDPVLMEIIDTPQFQRLRNIKQLGGQHFVYIGATHTRFEHSIGVSFIAGEMVQALREKHKNSDDKHLRITKKEILCVKIAALCHDLGHGPFSHVYDHVLERHTSNCDKEMAKLKKHEYRSSKIFLDIIYQNTLRLNKRLTKKEANFVAKMIEFSEYAKEKGVRDMTPNKFETSLMNNWNEDEMGIKKEKVYLFEIVANGFTGIDVDKMDYFARDGHGLGLPGKFNWRRFIQTVEVRKIQETGCYRICSLEKTVRNLYELFHTRDVLYRSACHHKTVVAVEIMIGDIIEGGNALIQFKGSDGSYYDILECWKNMEAFLQLDNSIIDNLQLVTKFYCSNATSPLVLMPTPKQTLRPFMRNAEKLQSLLERFHRRKLYKNIGKFSENHIEKILKKNKIKYNKRTRVKKFKDNFCKLIKHEANFKHERKTLTYGMGKKDPLRYHWVINKDDNTQRRLTKHQISRMLPREFEETFVFTYFDGEHDKIKVLRRKCRKL